MINVINNSNPGYMLLLLILYAQSIFGQIMFLQSLFWSSKYAGIVGTLIYFGFFLLVLPIQLSSAPASAKNGMAIFPQVAMYQACFIFGQMEDSGVGLQTSLLDQEVGHFTFGRALWMMPISQVVFTVLGLYLDRALP